jgi:hypothetical protein
MHRQAMEHMIDDIVSDISRREQKSPPAATAAEMTADIDTLLCEEDAASRQIMRRILLRLQQVPTAGK